MAANPFDQFDAKPANPFDQFDAKSGTNGQSAQPGWTDYLLQHLAGDPNSWNPNAPNKPLGQTAFWNKPADVSWGDYAQAHLQPLEDIGRSAANTFGIGDSLLASQKAVYNDITDNAQNTGPNANDYLSNLAAEKAKTAAAEARMPMQNSLAANVIGSGPISEVAASVRAAPYLSKLPGWLASRIAGATVGGVSTAAGEVGRNESFSPWDIGIGTLTGGVVGAPSKSSPAPAPPVPEGALRARAQTAYAPLDEYVFHGPSQIKPALDSVTNTMTQAEQDLAKQTMAKVNKLADTKLATGSDIQSYQQVFRDLSSSSVKADREYAPQFKNALETVMQGDPYGRNLTPGKGMSLMLPGSMGNTGLKTGGAAEARDAGDVFFGRAEDVHRLDDPTKGWIAQSQVKGGPDVGNQISSWLRTAEGQRYAPQPAAGAPPNAFTAYNTAAGTGAKPESVPWWVKHFVIAPTIGMGATEAINAATGQEHQSPMARVGEDLAVGSGLALGGLTYRGLTGKLNQLTQQRALDALRSTISTGNYQAPMQPGSPLRDAIRSIIYGQGAAGKLPGQ